MDYGEFIHKAKQEDLTNLIEFLDLGEVRKNPLLYFEKPELLQKVLENTYYIKTKDFGKILSVMMNETTKLEELNEENTFDLEYFRLKNWLDHAIARGELKIDMFLWFLTLKTDFYWNKEDSLIKEEKIYFKIHKYQKNKIKVNPWIEESVIEADWFFKTEGFENKILKKLLKFYDDLELEEYQEKDNVEQAVKKISKMQEQWKFLCIRKIKDANAKELYQSILYTKDFSLLKIHEHIYKKTDLTDLVLSFRLKEKNTIELLELISEKSRKARLFLALKKERS